MTGLIAFPPSSAPEEVWELLRDIEMELNMSHVWAGTPLMMRLRNMREDYEKFLNSTVEQNQLEIPFDPDE